MLPFVDRWDRYELWDLDSGNCIGMYDTEPEALADVRDTVQRYGREAAVTLGLGRRESETEFAAVADLAALVARAEEIRHDELYTLKLSELPAAALSPGPAPSGAGAART